MSRYIDADKLIKAVEHWKPAVSKESIIKALKSCKTADVVEVRHGCWIEHTTKPDWLEDDVEVFYNCSVCGTSHWSITPNFCPNCGADMRKRG